MKKITLLSSILIFFMLIFTILIPTVSSELYEKNNDIPEGLWFIFGFFKYLDENVHDIYLRVINARLTGIGNGFMFYTLRFPIYIKISKPFHGFLSKNSILSPIFGFCKKWDYVEYNNESESNLKDKYVDYFSNNYQIELNGKFMNAMHFIYRKTILPDIYSIGLSLISFSDAEVNINNGETFEYGDGVLFLYRYRGIYDHESNEDSLIIDGNSKFLILKMK